MAFGEYVDPTAAIRGILDNYPFSVGLFRELLQNSDDARASKQVRPTLDLMKRRMFYVTFASRYLSWTTELMLLALSIIVDLPKCRVLPF
jgi:hypothetical protein